MEDYQKVIFTHEVPISDVSIKVEVSTSDIKVEMTLKNDYTLEDVICTFAEFCKNLGFYKADIQTIIDILEGKI